MRIIDYLFIFFQYSFFVVCFLKKQFSFFRIWCLADQKVIPNMDPEKWGWILNEDGFSPRWMTIPEATEACRELIKCGCKKRCQGRCKCKKANLLCTELCSCSGDCVEK